MAYTPTPGKNLRLVPTHSLHPDAQPSILLFPSPTHFPNCSPLPSAGEGQGEGAFRSCGDARHQDHFALTPIRQGRGQRSWNLAIAFSFPVTGSSLPVRAARVPVLSAFHASEHGKALRRRLFNSVNSALADSREYRPARAGRCSLRLHRPARQSRSGRARRCRGSAVSRSRRHCMWGG